MPEETNSLSVSSIAANTYVKTYSADRRPALALIGNVTAVAITLSVSAHPYTDHRRTQQRSRRCRKSTRQLCYVSTYVDVREISLSYDRNGAEYQNAESQCRGAKAESLRTVPRSTRQYAIALRYSRGRRLSSVRRRRSGHTVDRREDELRCSEVSLEHDLVSPKVGRQGYSHVPDD